MKVVLVNNIAYGSFQTMKFKLSLIYSCCFETSCTVNNWEYISRIKRLHCFNTLSKYKEYVCIFKSSNSRFGKSSKTTLNFTVKIVAMRIILTCTPHFCLKKIFFSGPLPFRISVTSLYTCSIHDSYVFSFFRKCLQACEYCCLSSRITGFA